MKQLTFAALSTSLFATLVSAGSTGHAPYANTTTNTDATATASLTPAQSSALFPSSYSQWPMDPAAMQWSHPNLPQQDTNGNAMIGTLDAPRFPPFKPWGPPGRPTRTFPWGDRTAEGTDPYHDPPNTGDTCSYKFVVERSVKAPDGVERNVMLINGQFPGPTIECNWGDTIQVTVENRIAGPEEGTSFHWHGLLQRGTPYEDGVPGITQNPIAPGETFTYSFKADLYGTSWYHAHYSAQYSDGLFGAMVIHGPKNADYDADLGPVILSDTYHRDYFSIVQDVMGTDPKKAAPKSDNNLINGKGSFACNETSLPCTPNAGYSKFQFTRGKTYRLRLINAGAEGMQHFSIDQHTMRVIAYDFVPIVPYDTTVVALGIGQRADVIVKADAEVDAAWMRAVITSCSLSTQPNGFATVYYDNADTSMQPSSTAWPDNLDPCANDDLSKTTPFHPMTPPAVAEITQPIDIALGVNATNHTVWQINNSAFRVNYNDPILFDAQQGIPSFAPERNVYNVGEASSIRLVINNRSPIAHPMHIHGHNMFILAEGTGSWDYSTVVNPSNPTRRDVQMLRPNGYMVMQLDADNPGVWPFHCHIAWHVSGGLYLNILERPADLAKIQVRQEVLDLRGPWEAFTAEGPIDQIDSGL